MRPPDIRLRPMVADDYPFLRALYAEVRADELAITGWSDEQKAMFCNMQFDAQDRHYREHYPGATFEVIERLDAAGTATAIGRVYWAPLPDAKQDVLMEISIIAAARGKGIGTALIGEGLTRAAALGRSVSLHVEPNNPAHHLYTSLGFVRINNTGVYDEMRWQPPTV